jgi:hypothetical protein
LGRIVEDLYSGKSKSDVVRNAMSSLVGGTNAAIIKSAAGAVTEPGMPMRDTAVGEALRAVSGRERNKTQPLGEFFIQQILGKMWQAKDFRAADPKATGSNLQAMRLAMYKGAGVESEDAMRRKMREAGGTEFQADELANKILIKRAIDRSVKHAWTEYKQAYMDLYGKSVPDTIDPDKED